MPTIRSGGICSSIRWHNYFYYLSAYFRMVYLKEDKIKHILYGALISLGIGICIVCSLAICGVHSSATTLAIFIGSWLGGFFCGVGKEFGDYVYATWDWADIIAGAIGSTIGSAVIAVINLLLWN